MFDFRNGYGALDGGRPPLFNRMRKLPPLDQPNETPPIIDNGPMHEEGRHAGVSMGDKAPQGMPWKSRIGGTLGSVGSMFDSEEEEPYLEPMQMQPQQGQMFAPPQQQQWWMNPPKRRMY